MGAVVRVGGCCLHCICIPCWLLPLPLFCCGVGGGFSFSTKFGSGSPLEPKWICILISNGVCLLPIIHRFSLTGHPHCLAIILVTQTNVELMVATSSTIIVFHEGLFSLPKSCVDDIVFHSDSVLWGDCRVWRSRKPGLSLHLMYSSD